MKCKDCVYFWIKEPAGFSLAFCSNYENYRVGQIKRCVRKCKYYKKKDVGKND